MRLPLASACNTLTYSQAYVRAPIEANFLAFRAASMAGSWRPVRARSTATGKLGCYLSYISCGRRSEDRCRESPGAIVASNGPERETYSERDTAGSGG